MDGGSAGTAGAVFRPTAMDGGSAGREAVSEKGFIHWTNAGAVSATVIVLITCTNEVLYFRQLH